MKRLVILPVVAAIACLACWGLVRAATEPAPVEAEVSLPPDARSFDAEAATEAYLSLLSPEARARSDAYFEGGYWLLLWDFLAAAVIAWAFLGTGLSARLRDWTVRLVRWRWLQTAIFGALYGLISTLLLLPWSAYRGFFREHQYGMSNHTLGGWLSDQAKAMAIGVILGSLVITAVYAVLRKAPRTWWLWGSLVTIAFAVLSVTITPVYLEPVFNRFEPLAEGTLKEEILSLARANGIPATDVFQYDASRQTKRMSAHVSGLFGTVQISMNDNLLDRGSREEILAVMGHEMGHYILNHGPKLLTAIGLIIIGGFAFMRWSFEKVRAGYGAHWGVRDVGDVAGLPLLVFLFLAYSFVLTPVQNTIVRITEAEADNYGINASRQPDGFARAALHLAEYRKMVPGPIEESIFYDHPSGWNRIHRCMVWKAEHISDPDIAAYDAAHPGGPRLP